MHAYGNRSTEPLQVTSLLHFTIMIVGASLLAYIGSPYPCGVASAYSGNVVEYHLHNHVGVTNCD